MQRVLSVCALIAVFALLATAPAWAVTASTTSLPFDTMGESVYNSARTVWIPVLVVCGLIALAAVFIVGAQRLAGASIRTAIGLGILGIAATGAGLGTLSWLHYVGHFAVEERGWKVERLVQDSAEICQGAIKQRTLLGVPTSLTIGLAAVLGILVLVWGHWWVLVPGGGVYGWLRWQTKKDPLWLRTWWDHMQVADEYNG